MFRPYVAPLLALVSSPWLVACSHAAAAPPPTSAQRPAPVALAWRVVRGGDGEGAVLAGRTDLERDARGAVVKVVAPHNAAEAEIALTARDTQDGGTLVRVSYEERAADGALIRWEPELRLVRGSPAHAEASGAGWRRTLELTVE